MSLFKKIFCIDLLPNLRCIEQWNVPMTQTQRTHISFQTILSEAPPSNLSDKVKACAPHADLKGNEYRHLSLICETPQALTIWFWHSISIYTVGGLILRLMLLLVWVPKVQYCSFKWNNVMKAQWTHNLTIWLNWHFVSLSVWCGHVSWFLFGSFLSFVCPSQSVASDASIPLTPFSAVAETLIFFTMSMVTMVSFFS